MKQVVVWSVDPFEPEMKPGLFLTQNLLDWAQRSDVQVQPVYVLPLSDTEKLYSNSVEDAFKVYLKDFPDPTKILLPLKVVLAQSIHRIDEVKELVIAAEEVHSAFILVTSHGRSGVSRLILGSFAENLLKISSLPVLFSNHLEDRKNSFERALFSTNFSVFSELAYKRFLVEAKRFEFQVILFYSVSLPVSVLGSEYDTDLLVPISIDANQVNWVKAKSEIYLKAANSAGVKVDFFSEDTGVNIDIANSILRSAKEHRCDFLVMASVSKAFESVVVGSVAEKLFRNNEYPAWVYGRKCLEAGL